jgi:Zn-dependent peptidase ImmA (M78 family)
VAIDTATLVPKKHQTNLLERGFKTRSENISALIRSKLDITPVKPLTYKQLASYLSVDILELVNLKHLALNSKTYLASKEGDEWSAVTVASSQRVVIVANPSHSAARHSSSIMHELAHIILEHAPSKVFVTDTSFALRDYDEKQEAEADWLAGSLLLPRVALQKAIYQNLPKATVLSEYSVSSDLYEYRKRITGITRQYK